MEGGLITPFFIMNDFEAIDSIDFNDSFEIWEEGVTFLLPGEHMLFVKHEELDYLNGNSDCVSKIVDSENLNFFMELFAKAFEVREQKRKIFRANLRLITQSGK